LQVAASPRDVLHEGVLPQRSQFKVKTTVVLILDMLCCCRRRQIGEINLSLTCRSDLWPSLSDVGRVCQFTCHPHSCNLHFTHTPERSRKMTSFWRRCDSPCSAPGQRALSD